MAFVWRSDVRSTTECQPEISKTEKPFKHGHQRRLSNSDMEKLDGIIFGDFENSQELEIALHSLIPQLLALRKIQSSMTASLTRHDDKLEESPKKECHEMEETESFPRFQFLVLHPALQRTSVLNRLEVLSFFHKLWLRRIHLTSRDGKERRNLDDLENAIYCAQQVIHQFQDLVLRNDIQKSEHDIARFEDILETACEKIVQEKHRLNFEMLEDDVLRFRSHTVRLCSLLGLRLDFLDRLDEIPDKIGGHWIISEWIVNFLQENFKSLSSSNKASLSRDLLISIGFDPMSTATEKILARAGNMKQHIEACEWAEIFINDEFKYNLLLSPQCRRFPFRSDLTNKWFQLPRINVEEEKDEDLCHVNIINLVTKESETYRNQFELTNFPQQLEDDEHVVLFHGTDHQSACDILSRGIDLCLGRQKRDFSSGSGFYLTNSLEDAMGWASSTTAKPSVLVFCVKRECFDKVDSLSLHGNREKWHDLVRSCRTGRFARPLRKSLSSFDFIEGPVASITRSESNGELSIEPKASSFQMCLISDDFANEFQQSLHSILFCDSVEGIC